MTMRCTRRSVIAAAGLAITGGISRRAMAAEVDDIAMLNHALALEHLQAALYTTAERLGAPGHIGARVASALGGVERAHVAALTEALGPRALPPPLFDLRAAMVDDASFIAHAVAIEDLAAGVHLHHVPRLNSAEHRGLLASIHTVDAGHAAWIRLLAGVTPVVDGLDEPVSATESARTLLASGLARPRPGTASDSPWAAMSFGAAALLAAFPLAPRAIATPGSRTGDRDGGGGSPWVAQIATTAVVSALVAGGLGLRARQNSARRMTIVGPEEGPTVLQRATTPHDDGEPRVAPGGPTAQTGGVNGSPTPRTHR